MKRLALVIAVTALTALATSPVASSHTGTATITCDSVTFSYEQFKDPTTVIHEIVRIDGVTVASRNFTLQGASGSDTIEIDVPSGTHEVIARAEWSDSEGGGFFRVREFVTCDGEPPPPPAGDGCTFTKGFYRNHPEETASIIESLSGDKLQVGNKMLNASKVQQILKATPGRPGNVRFTSNLLLNLVQQLITAELNVASGADASASTEDAIDDANAAISVVLQNGTIRLSTTLSKNGMSNLVDSLSSFNEGQEGVPHCD